MKIILRALVALLALVGVAAAQVDTTSPNLQLLLMATGLHPNDWGDNTNANLQKIEDAITATTSISTTGGNITLTQAQNRSSALSFTGTLVLNSVVTVQSTPKMWVVRNGTSGAFTLSIKTASGAAVVVPQTPTNPHYYWCDGTTIYDVSTDALPTLGANTVYANIGAGPAAVSLTSFLSALGLSTTSSPVFANIQINGAPATDRRVNFLSAGLVRWSIATDNSTESGSNAGSNFIVQRFTDAGALIGTALEINRATGAVNIPGAVTVQNQMVTPHYDGATRNLKIIVQNDTSISVTADLFTAYDGTSVRTFRGLSSTLLTSCASAINCMDIGGPGTNRWLNVWLVGNPTTGASAAVLTQAAAPTPPSPLPSGYTMYMRAGAVRVDGSSNLFRTKQVGARAEYTITPATNTAAYPVVNNTNSTYWGTRTVLGNGFPAPPTAVSASLALQSIGGGSPVSINGVSPNPNFGTASSSNPPYAWQYGIGSRLVDLFLESSNVYVVNDNGAFGYINLVGWTDSIR